MKSQFIHTFSFLGAAGIAVGYPLDTVKVRIQTQDISKGVKYRGTFQCLATIMREEGVRIEIYSHYHLKSLSFLSFGISHIDKNRCQLYR